MRPTKNTLPAAKRTKTADILNRLLADALDLKSQAKQAHWNVRGEQFIALHELFDKVATSADEAVDLIAERVVQLGGVALGTVRVAAKASRLKEYPLAIESGVDHTEALSSALAAAGGATRKAIDDTDALGDAVTADMLTAIAADLDKYLWFVESHLPLTKVSSRKTA